MRVVASEFISLDGVVQAPGGAEEDTSGGFRHGGWSYQFFDPDVMGSVIGEIAERSEALLQGRRTYQVSAEAWPERGGDPFADWINAAQKYVVSDTLTEADLTWHPTTIIRGDDLVEKVSELRDQPGGDIYIYGSLTLVRALLTAGLLDELDPDDRADHPRRRQDPVPHRRRGADLRARLGPDRGHRRAGLPLPSRSRFLTPVVVTLRASGQSCSDTMRPTLGGTDHRTPRPTTTRPPPRPWTARR